MGGVDIWVLDSRRPWNLSNVFGIQNRVADVDGELVPKVPGVDRGSISESFLSGQGGIIVFDDGDIDEELAAERDAYCSLAEMPDVDDDAVSEGSDDVPESEHGDEYGIPESGQRPSSPLSESEHDQAAGQKRKRSSSHVSQDESDPDEGTPGKRQRSNSSSPVPVTPTRAPRRSLLALSDQDDLLPSPSLPVAPSPSKDVSAKSLRRRLLQLRRKHDAVLQAYYNLGTSYSEPISSMLYNLAADLGVADNDYLWYGIVGVSSMQLSGRTSSGLGLAPVSTSGSSSSWNRNRGELVKAVFRDEVRRLNPPDLKEVARDMSGTHDAIQKHAKSPTDMSIRLSPEPKFLLIRHWSLYESMLHSPYLSAKLRMWSETGRRRLAKLLAKMGVSLNQCKQNYTHMDMDLKRGLREKLLKYAPIYGLEGLVPPDTRRTKDGWGFVRCWGWKACLNAMDVGVIIGAVLEVGDVDPKAHRIEQFNGPKSTFHSGSSTPLNPEFPLATAGADAKQSDTAREDALVKRFFAALDSLSDVTLLTTHIPTAQHLHRCILRTGTSLIEKRQVRRLSAFSMAMLKEGPDLRLFTHPGALTKLALWVAEAMCELEGIQGRKGSELVLASLDEERSVYVVVGLGGGSAVSAQKERDARRADKRKEREKCKQDRRAEKERERELRRRRLEALGEDDDEDGSESESSDSDDSSDDEEEERPEHGKGFNRFGNAFQEAINETSARVKVDSFEHCVVEVQKEDFRLFLESLCKKAVVG